MEQQNLNALINQIVREILTRAAGQEKAKAEPSARLYLVEQAQQRKTFQQSEYYRQLAKLFEVVVIEENAATDRSGATQPYTDLQALNLDEQTQFLFPFLSSSNLARAALGITDTFETKWLAYCFQHQLPAVALREGLPCFQREVSKAYRALFVSYERIVRTFGLRIVTKEQFLQEKESKQNEIITSVDLDNLAANDDLVLSERIIITPLAMDEIKRRKIHTKTVIGKEAR